MRTDEFVIPPDAAEKQRIASDPSHSVWVSANAGAGKTKVLTDRVIRLMLAGSAPSRILCLTFTKAAAAEMTIRALKTLGDWVTLEDGPLAGALLQLTGEKPDRKTRAAARRLFARAVETPGGLKIETIHAFCERLLHLVPFEAGVPPRFAVLDDAEATELMAEARARVLTGAAGTPGLSDALEAVASEVSGDALVRLIADAVAAPAVPDDPAALSPTLDRLRAALLLRAGESPDTVRREMVDDGIPPVGWTALAEALRAVGGASNEKAAEKLARALAATSVTARAEHYAAFFFTADGEPVKRLVTKAAPDDLRVRLEAEQGRLVVLKRKLLAAECLARTAALYVVAGAVRATYRDLKRRLGALDFADLIDRTLALLDGGHAPWVLYRLDRGIDHVLVDEAQDTNAEQWRILRRLTEEFTAGAGLPKRGPRTIFAVGDPKQSIYSFQGADPLLFEDGRRHWLGLHRAAGLGFADIRLALSFRSATAVLQGVDWTFGVQAHLRGVSFEATPVGTAHESARPRAAGHVEIWPTEMPSGSAESPDAWSLPVDAPDPASPALVAAGRVARAVKHWLSRPDPDTGRVWRAGDVLILARKRGPAFFGVIRALKAEGVPVAGADRIDIGRQIAVQDLVAAGQVALLPGHDLALAAVLKSPLVGLDDDDLIRIAADRPEGRSVFDALNDAAASDRRLREAAETLGRWRALAARHGPFGFYAALLGPEGGRRHLVERLGGEAEDAIDTFLCHAGQYEQTADAPSLTAFLARFEAAEHVIKRDPEAAGDEVRVMTVHGAKGLEAPLVVLLDGCEVAGRDPTLVPLPTGPRGDPVPVWAPGRGSDPPPVAAARLLLQERAHEEHNRLLYVALTRARDRLVLVPYTGLRGLEPEGAWCAMVRAGFAAGTGALTSRETPYGIVEVFRLDGQVAAPPALGPGAIPIAVPDWLTRPVPPEPEPLPPLQPSGALGAAEREPGGRTSPGLRDERRQDARRRGVLFHALLDRLAPLPGDAREAAADRFLSARGATLSAGDRARVKADALRVLNHPDLLALFGPDSRGEVAVAGRIGPPGRERAVSGRIDRLAIGPDAVVAADLKTGRPPRKGAVPDAFLAQMAVYRELLRETHPGRAVRALLVWPEGPLVQTLSDARLDEALARVLALP